MCNTRAEGDGGSGECGRGAVDVCLEEATRGGDLTAMGLVSTSPRCHAPWAANATTGDRRTGIAVIDGAGDLWFANAVAVRCLRDYFGMVMSASPRVPPRLRAWSATKAQQPPDHGMLIMRQPKRTLVIRPIREMGLHPHLLLHFREYEAE